MKHDRNVQRLLDLVERGHKVSFDAEVRDHGVADQRPFTQLVTGQDGGGWRQFLDGKPVTCGSTLELECYEECVNSNGDIGIRSAGSIEVRYEMTYDEHDRRLGVIYYDIAGHHFGPNFLTSKRFRWPRREED